MRAVTHANTRRAIAQEDRQRDNVVRPLISWRRAEHGDERHRRTSDANIVLGDPPINGVPLTGGQYGGQRETGGARAASIAENL